MALFSRETHSCERTSNSWLPWTGLKGDVSPRQRARTTQLGGKKSRCRAKIINWKRQHRPDCRLHNPTERKRDNLIVLAGKAVQEA